VHWHWEPGRASGCLASVKKICSTFFKRPLANQDKPGKIGVKMIVCVICIA